MPCKIVEPRYVLVCSYPHLGPLISSPVRFIIHYGGRIHSLTPTYPYSTLHAWCGKVGWVNQQYSRVAPGGWWAWPHFQNVCRVVREFELPFHNTYDGLYAQTLDEIKSMLHMVSRTHMQGSLISCQRSHWFEILAFIRIHTRATPFSWHDPSSDSTLMGLFLFPAFSVVYNPPSRVLTP